MIMRLSHLMYSNRLHGIKSFWLVLVNDVTSSWQTCLQAHVYHACLLGRYRRTGQKAICICSRQKAECMCTPTQCQPAKSADRPDPLLSVSTTTSEHGMQQFSTLPHHESATFQEAQDFSLLLIVGRCATAICAAEGPRAGISRLPGCIALSAACV